MYTLPMVSLTTRNQRLRRLSCSPIRKVGHLKFNYSPINHATRHYVGDFLKPIPPRNSIDILTPNDLNFSPLGHNAPDIAEGATVETLLVFKASPIFDSLWNKVITSLKLVLSWNRNAEHAHCIRSALDEEHVLTQGIAFASSISRDQINILTVNGNSPTPHRNAAAKGKQKRPTKEDVERNLILSSLYSIHLAPYQMALVQTSLLPHNTSAHNFHIALVAKLCKGNMYAYIH